METKFSDSRESSSALGARLRKFVNLSDNIGKIFLKLLHISNKKKN